jgi:16S rRNA (cytosine1402-N4)-methyltransferase
MSNLHIPVLQKEVIEYLSPRANQNFIDCTIGEGGHAFAILEKILPNGKILGIDWTPELISKLKAKIKKFKKNFIIVCDNFVHLEKIVKKYKFKNVYGILLDLGMSSWHLEKSGKGFSFQKNEILDMRYNPKLNTLTAEKIINEGSQKEIEKILKEYGQERFAKKITREIIKAREIKPIKKTFHLLEIIKKATPSWYHRQRIHFATKTFQALRIAVNKELENLKKVLPQALEILEREGRLVIISFHSLEDKIVKNFFKENSKKKILQILTKKPIVPSKIEVKINPRSRSAKLRAIIKL